MTGLRELRGGRVEVELEGAPWRVLPVDVVVRAGLHAGRPLDRPLARALARELRRARALAHAGRALRTRDRSAGELDARLAQRGVPAPARAEALAALERSGLVDDARFAAGRAATLARKGFGNAAIRADLEARGLGPEAIADAVAQLEPERERALRAVAARPPGPATVRWLAGRGFGDDALEAVAADVVAADP